MSPYVSQRTFSVNPCLPLEGNIDLTYRCNNMCCHCWLRLPQEAEEREEELNFDEIVSVVSQARSMGCRGWNISGGEPMLRPDFPEIFDYITRNCASYSINTNGTLIDPQIARLMTRAGVKMVALYGATPDVHDLVTGRPGAFEATVRGLRYLKEVGADFVVQLVPMRANYHQLKEMYSLAESLSPHWKIGAAWLYLTACADPARNEQIRCQRLDPRQVVELDAPGHVDENTPGDPRRHASGAEPGDDRVFAACLDDRAEFHVDPYGEASFCCFIKKPDLRYGLRTGSFQEYWDEFLPSLRKLRCGKEYRENCGSCKLRSDCYWCPAYAFLEHGRLSAKVDYLCDVASEVQGELADEPPSLLQTCRDYYPG